MDDAERLVADYLKRVANIEDERLEYATPPPDEKLEDIYEKFKTDQLTKALVMDYLARHNYSEVLGDFLKVCRPNVYAKQLRDLPRNIAEELMKPINCSDGSFLSLEKVCSEFKNDQFTKALVDDYLAKNEHFEVLTEFRELCGPIVYHDLGNYPKNIILEFLEPLKCDNSYEKPILEEIFKQYKGSDENKTAVNKRTDRNCDVEMNVSNSNENNVAMIRRRERNYDVELDGRNYDELVPLAQVFKEQIKHFQPKEDSELDSVVKYLMHENLEAPLITFKIKGSDLRHNKENQKK